VYPEAARPELDRNKRSVARFDTTLKTLFLRSPLALVRELTDSEIARWLNVELPRVDNLRVDLIGESGDGRLIQFEFQTGNDPSMALRMAEYYLGIYRQLNRFPLQIVVYVADQPLRMKAELRTPDASLPVNRHPGS
jgi:hypothetical protein